MNIKTKAFMSLCAILGLIGMAIGPAVNGENEVKLSGQVANPTQYLETSKEFEKIVYFIEETKKNNFKRYINISHLNDVKRANAMIAEANRIAANKAKAKRIEAAKATRPAPAQSQVGSGRCGGDLPPCYVMMRESRGDIRAENPTSSASGKWQFIDSTWAGFGGYSHASYAPESVQDAKARMLWAGGAGCGHWSAC